MIPIIDDRLSEELNLCEIDLGGTFLWNNEYVCIRVDPSATNVNVKDDHLLCMFLRTGELIEIGRLAWVTPIKCELIIKE